MAAKLSKSAPAAKPIRRPRQPRPPDAGDLLAWYERHARRLPWRVGPEERRLGVRPDPYGVLLSEVMLQQTGVKAVAPYYRRFLERWPTIADLAAAPETEVMAAWAGLGYYSRARNLIAAARMIAARPGARFPQSAAELATLPGIGAYTSAAIARDRLRRTRRGRRRECGAGRRAPLRDRNALPRREGGSARSAANDSCRANAPGEFAEALMDLGATICTPRRPACALCPWSEPCVARREGRQAEFPREGARRSRGRCASAAPSWRGAPTARSCSAAGRRAGCSAA